MWYCEDCKKTFVEPDYTLDSVEEYWGAPCHTFISVCPYCGSDEIRTMNRCPICGEYHEGSDDVCDLCQEDITLTIRRIKDEVIAGGLEWDAYSEELAERLTE